MKQSFLRIIIASLLLVLVSSCGYYFPHVYTGPDKTVYMPTWKNRTDKLGLDAKLYQSLSKWFQKSDSIRITKKKEEADLILAGEITFIELPSVSWAADARTTDVKVRLGVRYVLKDQKTGKLLWEVPHELWTEDYNARTIDTSAENEALDQIIDDLSERIYLGTLERIRKQNREQGITP